MSKRAKSKRFVGVHVDELQRKHNGKPDKTFYITYKDLNGKLVYEKVGCASENYTEALASQIRAERIRALRHGDELPQRRRTETTIKDFAKKYVAWSKANKKSWRNDKSTLNNYIVPKFGARTFDEVVANTYELDQWKNELAEGDLAPATITMIFSVFRSMTTLASEWGEFRGTFPKIKQPALKNGRLRYLSYEEAADLLKRAKAQAEDENNTTAWAVYEVALLSLTTGGRLGEILNVTRQDVDLENGVIRIVPKDTNGNKGHEYLHLTDQATEMLVTKFEREKRRPNDYLWSVDGSRPIQKSWLGPKFRMLTAKFNEGVKDAKYRVVFHTLRHTFASWLAIQGEALLTIKELMRHSDIKMTMRYAHLCPDVKRSAINRFQDNFGRLFS
jgi:integrase